MVITRAFDHQQPQRSAALNLHDYRISTVCDNSHLIPRVGAHKPELAFTDDIANGMPADGGATPRLH